MLHNKTILVGVSGGIAAYKACDVIGKLRKCGARVYVIMTAAAAKFITPLTLQTLSNNFVVSDMFGSPAVPEVEHVSLAKKADLTLIVPATANIIGKIAAGIADDMLTTTVTACPGPIMLAPAMNTVMYRNPIVRENIAKLKGLGYLFVEPASGLLACGDEGEGKLADTDTIVGAVTDFFATQTQPEAAGPAEAAAQDLTGVRILVTAGPTREKLDPIRYLSNASTGKMGYAVAGQAAKRGADVTLISGPASLEVPEGLKKTVRIESADELFAAVMTEFPAADVIIQSAAVADYKPKRYSEIKIKKGDDDLRIELERNKDIAYEIGKIKGDKISVGFALETNDVIENAVQKVRKKNFNFIVANDFTEKGAGCGVDTNVVTIIDADGTIKKYPQLPKTAVADIILDTVASLLNRK